MGAACTSTSVGRGGLPQTAKAALRAAESHAPSHFSDQSSSRHWSKESRDSNASMGMGASSRRLRLMSNSPEDMGGEAVPLHQHQQQPVVEVTPPRVPRRLSKEDDEDAQTTTTAAGGATTPTARSLPATPPPPFVLPEDVAEMEGAMSARDAVAHKVFRVKCVKNIVTGDETLNGVRREMYEELRRNHASENIEFMYEVQGLQDLVKAVQKSGGDALKSELHKALTDTITDFIQLGAPHEVCITRTTREAILASAEDLGLDLDTYRMLYALAFGEILADTIQNPEFQAFLYRLVDDGVVEVKSPTAPLARQTYVEGKSLA